MKCVSIVIPFYNRREYVKIMVESIINQRYTQWELLMIDDGSGDGSKELVENLSRKDDRIKYISRADYSSTKGACSSRNVGLRLARGEYIIFFDSDDWIPQDCISNRVSFLESKPDLDFAVFPLYFYSSNNRKGLVISGIKTHENDYFNFQMRNLPFTVVCNIYRKDALISHGIIWDEKLLSIQDADFNIQCLENNLTYDYCGQYGADYYVRMYNNGNSVSRSVLKEEHILSHLHYVKKRIDGISSVRLFFRLYIYLLVASFFNLIFPNEKAVNKILDLTKPIPSIYHFLKIKISFALTLNKIGLSKRLCFWVAFPLLPFLYNKSSIIRKLKSRRVYDKSRLIIDNICDLMLINN